MTRSHLTSNIAQSQDQFFVPSPFFLRQSSHPVAPFSPFLSVLRLPSSAAWPLLSPGESRAAARHSPKAHPAANSVRRDASPAPRAAYSAVRHSQSRRPLKPSAATSLPLPAPSRLSQSNSSPSSRSAGFSPGFPLAGQYPC